MQCQYLGSRWPLARGWHLLGCRECRAARAADVVVFRGIQRLNAEPAPPDGLRSALEEFGATYAVPRARARRWAAILNYRLFPAGALTAVAAVGSIGWLTYIDIDPAPANTGNPPKSYEQFWPIDARKHGSQNAYDILSKAINAIPASEKTFLAHSSIPSATYANSRVEDALDHAEVRAETVDAHQAPVASIVGRAQSSSATAILFRAKRANTTEEKEELLREYSDAFAIVRQGFAFPYQAPPYPMEAEAFYTETAGLPFQADYRQLARALTLDAKVKAARRDYGGAVESSLDAMELGAQIEHGGLLIGKLNGLGCESLGRAVVWKLIEHLDGAQALSAAHRVEHINQIREPFDATLEEEKWTALATMQTRFQSRDWRRRFERERTSATPTPLIDLATFVHLMPLTKRKIVDDYSTAMDYYIADARLPYCRSLARPGSGRESDRIQLSIQHRMQVDSVAAAYLLDTQNPRFREVAGPETQNALLMTSLAIHAFEVEHKVPPRSLGALVPRYLSCVPVDPFGQGQTLGYRYSERRTLSIDGGKTWHYALYSVGPDCKDDGGKPIQFKNEISPANPALNVYRDRSIDTACAGDIVAGINIFN